MKEQNVVAFSGTKEQEEQLLKVIETHKGEAGALIPVLHETQEIYGYLPEEAQKIISRELHIPMAEIYGVITFYTQFSLKPKGKYKVGICLGTACYVKGSGKILEQLKQKLQIVEGECTEDGKFSLDATRCIGACGLAPVMTVNDDVYGKLLPEDIDDILAKYND